MMKWFKKRSTGLKDKANTAWLKAKADPADDNVEIITPEVVDPDAPIEQGEAEAEALPPLSFREKIQAWIARRKRAVYHFFVPQPVMVPAQLKTPEIDLEGHGQPTKLKGQMIYLVITGFVIVAIAWAALAEIDELVRAEGDIVPSESVQMVQSRLPGSVVAIHAELGNTIRQGDVLFEVEDEDVRANFDDNEIQRRTALATSHRLVAESTGAEAVAFPPELEAEAPDVVAQERAVFISRRLALESEQQVLMQEIESLRLGIREHEATARQAETQIESANRRIALIEQELAVIKPLVDQGFEPEIALLSIRGRLEDAVQNRNSAEAQAESARLAAQRTESDLETQTRRLDSLESRFRAEAETELVEVRTRAAQTLARLDALREKVAFTEIRAPVDGIITAVHVNTVGAVVDGGTVMAEIVPVDEEVTVRARVNTDDVSKITPGQEVYVTLTSHDVSRFGRLEGVVEQVAANSTQEQNLPPYFVAMIKVPNPVFAETGVRPEIVPGTPVVIDMIAGKRTVLGYMLAPINRAQTIVFREK